MSSHSTEGYIELSNVVISGTAGTSGSTLSWTGFVGFDTGLPILDDGDLKLDSGSDYWYTSSRLFTGYTIESGGVEYGIFFESGVYYVPLPVNGTGQTVIPISGTSNAWQAEATAYLCFAPGTLISTPEGQQPVEELNVDEMVLTSDGTPVPIKWIGRQTVSTRFGPAERLMPVRFAAGSLGNGLPHTDLTVTADHGMLVDGIICHAGALVNGTTITRVPLAEMGESFTVYHIETEEHEIILANGAPAETFIDNVSRRVFDNYAEFEALYGDVPEMEELPFPRAMSARQVPGHIKLKLAGSRAA